MVQSENVDGLNVYYPGGSDLTVDPAKISWYTTLKFEDRGSLPVELESGDMCVFDVNTVLVITDEVQFPDIAVGRLVRDSTA